MKGRGRVNRGLIDSDSKASAPPALWTHRAAGSCGWGDTVWAPRLVMPKQVLLRDVREEVRSKLAHPRVGELEEPRRDRTGFQKDRPRSQVQLGWESSPGAGEGRVWGMVETPIQETWIRGSQEAGVLGNRELGVPAYGLIRRGPRGLERRQRECILEASGGVRTQVTAWPRERVLSP